MIRKALTAILIISVLVSCASYTISDGYASIVVPENTGKPETRYRIIQEENKEKTQEAIENAKKEAEHRAAMKRNAEVNEYPEDISEITFPHIYTPLRTNATAENGINTFQILFLPLGEEEISDADIQRILASTSDLSPDFVVLTGSLSNQIKGARTAGWDAVTLEGGTILHKPLLKSADARKASFFITPTKDFDIAPVYLTASLPSSEDGIGAWLESISAEAESNLKIVQDADMSMADRERIIALSSSEPVTEDWIEFTPFAYRTPHSFGISDYLSDSSYIDAYRRTHFTAEVDGGITRRNGSIYERMDSLWSASLIPESSVAFPVLGLTDTRGIFALLATYIFP